VRELAPFVLLVCACGAAVREPRAPSPAPAPSPVVEAPPDATASAAETTAAFDALSARSGELAPGMREVTRKETGIEGAAGVELVKAVGRDVCTRVAFQASEPVTVKLVDQGGTVLAASEGAITEGALGAHGPVCIRKGDVVRGRADGAGARVRWLAWAAP